MLIKVFAVPVVLIFLSTSCAMAQQSSCAVSDEAAIRKILAEFTAAWDAGSAPRYAALFREDADWENAFGGRRKSRKQIEEFIAARDAYACRRFMRKVVASGKSEFIGSPICESFHRR